MHQPTPLHTVQPDRASAHALRDDLADARLRLLDVLAARARALDLAPTWTGVHRRRFEDDTADLLAAGRQLDATLRSLLDALDAELAATP